MPADLLKLLEFFAYGAAGGLIGGVTKTGRIQLPRVIRRGVDPEDRVVLLDLGFVASMLLGGTVSMIVDGRPETGICYGLTAGFAGPAVLNAVLDPLLKKIGMSPAPPTPPGPIGREGEP